MIKQISKATKLHRHELNNIKKLVDISSNADNYKTKLYWNVLEDRQTQEFNDFLYYLDGNLVGYLALFTFKINEAEISAVIHPKFRYQKIFANLLEEAILELNKRHIEYALFICHQSAKTALEFCKKHEGIYAYSQVEMTATKPALDKTLPTIQMRPTTPDDVVTLAKIGSESFGSPFLEVLQRFIENNRDKSRKAWLISIAGSADYVGKIHVRYEANKSAFIHDLCILPEHRGKNYATAMILQTMAMIRAEGYKTITLDVEMHNKGALKLYEQCGFEVTSAYDFWRVPVKNLLKP